MLLGSPPTSCCPPLDSLPNVAVVTHLSAVSSFQRATTRTRAARLGATVRRWACASTVLKHALHSI